MLLAVCVANVIVVTVARAISGDLTLTYTRTHSPAFHDRRLAVQTDPSVHQQRGQWADNIAGLSFSAPAVDGRSMD